MLRKLFCIYALAMGITLLPATAATPSTTSSSSTQDEISREVKLAFAQISPLGQMKLNGVNPHGTIEFGMRSDEVATKRCLTLNIRHRLHYCLFSRNSKSISMMS